MSESTETIENNEGIERARRGRLLVVSLLAIAVIAVVVFGVVRLTAPDGATPGDAPTSTAEPTDQSTDDAEDDGEMIKQPGSEELAALSGQDLIDALGDRVEGIAKRNGMTADEFKNLLLRDSTVRVLNTGTIYHVDPPR